MQTIRTKREFYRRFYRGEFGNHGPMWRSLDEWVAAKYKGPIAIRTLVKGGRCDYWVPVRKVRARTAEFIWAGYGEDKLNWSAMAPEHTATMKGEVWLSPRGLEMFVSREKTPMRTALASAGYTVSGLRALCELRWAAREYADWILYLCERFGAVVEFTSFTQPWGVLPGCNTVIWEVRNY